MRQAQARGVGRRRAGRAAAAGVPAWPGLAGGEGGRRELQGARVALGRAEVAPREEQRGLAACAGGGRRVRGGAAALRRRRPRIRVGRGSGSEIGLRPSSPWIDFARRKAGRGSSTGGAELGAELDGGRQWRAAVCARFQSE